MELREDEIVEKYAKRCGHCNYNHMNTNGVVFLADSTYQNESMNSLKYNVKKLILSMEENMLNKKYFVIV